MSVEKFVNAVKKGGPIGTLATTVYEQFFGKEKDANKIYEQVYPLLMHAVKNGGVKSERAQHGFAALIAIAPTGAKGRNFKKRYVDKPDGWQVLPKDPKNIPYGYWY